MIGFLKDRWSCPGGYLQVLSLAFPLILSTGVWSVQLFVDRMFLSWYSAEAIAAATPAGIINFTVLSLFIGTVSYAGTFVAQYHGAGRPERIGPVLWQALYMSVFGGLFLLLFIPGARPLFALIGHDPAVQVHETAYLQALCLGGFPIIASAAMSGFFSGLGRAWPVMVINTIQTIINVALDYALIFGNWGCPELGVYGAGLASVAAACVSFFILVLLIGGTKANDRTFHTWRGWRLDPELFSRLLRYGLPNGVQFFLDICGFAVFVLVIGRIDAVSLAATNIAFSINTLAFMPMIGSGIAISILTGQYLGANRPDLAEKSTYSGFHLTSVYMIVIAGAYVLVPQIFVLPFSIRGQGPLLDEIMALTVVLLRFVALYSIFDGMNIVFSAAIKGAGDTRYVMIFILLASVFVLIIPTFAAVSFFGLGLMACWIFATLYASLLGVVFYFRFRGGKWKKMRVIETPGQPATSGPPSAA
ncbi:MAG: MATE family efflux transporter [Pseudomonadota bacterium]